MKEDNVKPVKTNGGDSIYLLWETKMHFDTELTILMNSIDRYYYEKVDTKQNQIEGERLSNFIIDPLFVMEDSDKRIKYVLKFVSNDYCILQVKSLEKCNEKFRTLPALIFFVINDSIKHVLHGNYHQ